MRFYSRDGREIASLEEWARLGKPAAESHWKPGRSAYELASDWIEHGAVRHVTELLALRSELAGFELQEGIAEKQTSFDDIPRGPRNHDLLIRGMSSAGLLVVAVEGKADEPFDYPIWRWRQRAMAELKVPQPSHPSTWDPDWDETGYHLGDPPASRNGNTP